MMAHLLVAGLASVAVLLIWVALARAFVARRLDPYRLEDPDFRWDRE
jgi:hypothetical protein